VQDEKVQALDNFVRMELRMLFGSLEDDWYWLANRAFHLLGWGKKNRFCGVCGSELSLSEDEVAFKCDKCGNIIYPRISPAVIVAITRGDEILLAHSARFAKGMYSVIAGFVEAGETLEECVEREIGEEVGIKVKNIRYFRSQPWPYPDSLMLAFTAEYESGEIQVDNEEITDAGWYTADNLPGLPSKASVARKLIDSWLDKVSNGQSRL
jgi:NAD+ diphosphatase